MASRYGFLTQQEREDAKMTAEEAETILREKRWQISEPTWLKSGPVIRGSLAEYFRSMGPSKAVAAGEEQAALFL